MRSVWIFQSTIFEVIGLPQYEKIDSLRKNLNWMLKVSQIYKRSYSIIKTDKSGMKIWIFLPTCTFKQHAALSVSKMITTFGRTGFSVVIAKLNYWENRMGQKCFFLIWETFTEIKRKLLYNFWTTFENSSHSGN